MSFPHAYQGMKFHFIPIPFSQYASKGAILCFPGTMTDILVSVFGHPVQNKGPNFFLKIQLNI
jgi:hypothetical protein